MQIEERFYISRMLEYTFTLTSQYSKIRSIYDKKIKHMEYVYPTSGWKERNRVTMKEICSTF